MSVPVIHRRWSRWPVAALIVVAGCARKGGADEAAKTDAHSEVAAETAVITTQSFTEVVGAIGTVVPRAGHVATLSAPAATRVANVLVATGQAVAKGDVLIELEQSGFQLALRSAAAAQLSARASRDRLKRLVDQGITPQRELDQAIADLAKADADVQEAQRMMDLSVLRAPIAGMVTRMSTSLGASVDPTTVLVEVADPATLDVLLSVQPADAARIKSGDHVALHPGQRATDAPLAAGEVVDVSGVVDSTSHSVTVRIRTTSSKRALRIGETLFGEIVVATRPRAVTVPIEALVPEGDGFKVFVVDSGEVAHTRVVTIGGKTDKVVEILTGLSAGDRVVTYGAFGVEDGARIVAAAQDSAAKPSKPDSAEKP
jgi:membrane fusion protein (multidrug efflux system)